MDHRCPACNGSLAKRKLIDAVITRMESECLHCKRKLRLNVHGVEQAAIIINFFTIVGLGALAYYFKSEPLMLATFAAVLIGSLVMPVMERTWLRSWPRYVIAD
jgi:hypothetical protein